MTHNEWVRTSTVVMTSTGSNVSRAGSWEGTGEMELELKLRDKSNDKLGPLTMSWNS